MKTIKLRSIAIVLAISSIASSRAQLNPIPFKEPKATWSANGGNIVSTFRNVGIGTSSPFYKLHVIGNTKFSGTLSLGANSFNFVPDVQISLNTFSDQIRSTNGNITFGNDAGSYSNIKVGIGTTNPASPLNITPIISTANFGTVSLGPGPWDGTSSGHFTGSTAGTILAINGPFTADYNHIHIQRAGLSIFKITSGGAFTLSAASGIPGGETFLNITPTTSFVNLVNEVPTYIFDGGGVSVSGSIATQRFVLFTQPRLLSGSISNESSTFCVVGPPLADPSATISKSVALRISSGIPVGTGVTNAYGLFVDAPTGAVNNYAASFATGNVGIGTTAPTARLEVVGPTGPTGYSGLKLTALATTTALPTNGQALSIDGSGNVILTTGAVGATGATGATGAAGTNGIDGATGATGTTGAAGTNGTDGATGATGTTGAAGTNGTNGADGATGPTGAAGANGINGADGATGSTGAAGTNGTNGTDGATGATGAAGTNGTNGADGATGSTGAAGTNGTNGADGATGPTGAAGTNGTNGADGATGATGVAGTNGTNGADGATGTTGAAGTNGTNGATGATGPTGPTGAAGATGSIGTNGVTGPTGAIGSTGAGPPFFL